MFNNNNIVYLHIEQTKHDCRESENQLFVVSQQMSIYFALLSIHVHSCLLLLRTFKSTHPNTHIIDANHFKRPQNNKGHQKIRSVSQSSSRWDA